MEDVDGMWMSWMMIMESYGRWCHMVLGWYFIYSTTTTQEELTQMCARLHGVRATLFQELQTLGTPGDWTHITAQCGMFSYTGLTAQQVQRLRSKWHVYMTDDGRMALAALRTAHCAYVARAIHDVVTNN